MRPANLNIWALIATFRLLNPVNQIGEITAMLRNTILLLLILFGSTTLQAHEEENQYYRTTARKGDNIRRLLKRYFLAGYDCNFDKFYQLNKLNSTSDLFEGRKYYLPVSIHRYNGRSIKTSLDLEGWEKAYRIKQYNERLYRHKLRQSTLVRSSLIWVPYHELGCSGKKAEPLADAKASTSTNLKPSDKERREYQKIDSKVLAHFKKSSGLGKFPIFGKKYEHVTIRDNKLRGQVFYVVSGHGGPDVGAVGKAGKHQLCEDEYAYDVSLRLVRKLIEHGAIAYMITRDADDGIRSEDYLKCDYDEYCWGDYIIPRSQKSRLYQRSDAINKLYEKHQKQGIKKQTTIVIHIDSRNTSVNTDVFFYYYPGSQKSRKIAQKLHQTFKSKYRKYRSNGQYHGTITSRDLHMLREPKTSSVFIELGNIRNRHDQQRFIRESNREALAKWLLQGLVR